LTACASSEPQVLVHKEVERLTIAPELLFCRESPAIPPAETQADAALILVDVWEAGADCRGKLRAVREALEDDAKAR
jgi:hypothetical protein